MAAVLIIAGSLLGLVVGLFAFAVFDSGLGTAFAIWALSGPASLLIVLAVRALRAPMEVQDSPHTV